MSLSPAEIRARYKERHGAAKLLRYSRAYRKAHLKEVRANAMRWYYAHKEQAQKAALLKYARFRLLIEEALTKCVRCGNEDKRVLEFHHVRGKKLYNVSEMKAIPLPKVVREIKKCVVVCANCHRIIEAEKRGVPKYKELI